MSVERVVVEALLVVRDNFWLRYGPNRFRFLHRVNHSHFVGKGALRLFSKLVVQRHLIALTSSPRKDRAGFGTP